MELIKKYWNLLKENYVGKIFYLTRVSAKVKPGKLANIYWILFTIASVTLMVLTPFFYGASWLTKLFWIFITFFLVGEGVGVFWLRIDLFGRGGTYSEWCWWYIRNPYIRTVWGYLLSIMVMIHWHPIPGSILALWLTAHLALKGKEVE